LQGTKRGWKNAGIERFNQHMIKVAQDCQANAQLADQNFLQYQRFLHGPRQPVVAEVEDALPQPHQKQIVYNTNFDLELLMEHANNNENNNDDNEDDSKDGIEEVSVEMEPV
jgi:hypothetical protein